MTEGKRYLWLAPDFSDNFQILNESELPQFAAAKGFDVDEVREFLKDGKVGDFMPGYKCDNILIRIGREFP